MKQINFGDRDRMIWCIHVFIFMCGSTEYRIPYERRLCIGSFAYENNKIHLLVRAGDYYCSLAFDFCRFIISVKNDRTEIDSLRISESEWERQRQEYIYRSEKRDSQNLFSSRYRHRNEDFFRHFQDPKKLILIDILNLSIKVR